MNLRRIVVIVTADCAQGKYLYRSAHKDGRLINGCGSKAAETILLTDNNQVIASSKTIDELAASIEKLAASIEEAGAI